jgi:hypothetical protein
LQGEGQEFESPRLHHHRPTADHKMNSSGPIPETPSPVRTGPRVPHRAPDPCPSHSWQATDQRIAGRRNDFGRARRETCSSSASHLNNWICFGRLNESSISPSSQDEMIPIRSQSATARLVRGWRALATNGTGWIPWRQDPMTDVPGCEMLRGVASRL